MTESYLQCTTDEGMPHHSCAEFQVFSVIFSSPFQITVARKEGEKYRIWVNKSYLFMVILFDESKDKCTLNC